MHAYLFSRWHSCFSNELYVVICFSHICVSILKDVPGIPEHVFQQHCNTESVNNLVSQAYVTSYSPAPKKRKAETSTINCTTTKTEEGTRRSERIRTGWRSAAMMAALLEAEKYQPNKARVGSPDRDCFSCVNVLQSATHNCNTCSSVPEIVVTQDELEKSLQFGQPKQSNLQQRADNNSYSNGSDSAGLLLPCGEVASGQLTPPTTPSTKSADFIDGVLSSSKLTTHKDVSTTCQQVGRLNGYLTNYVFIEFIWLFCCRFHKKSLMW